MPSIHDDFVHRNNINNFEKKSRLKRTQPSAKLLFAYLQKKRLKNLLRYPAKLESAS